MTTAEAIAVLEGAAAQASPEEAARLRAELVALDSICVRRLLSPAPSAPELMTIAEAAFRLRVSPKWLYRRRLPFKVPVGGKTLVDRHKLERWIKNRETA